MPKPIGNRKYLAPGEAYIARAGPNLSPAPADLKTHGGYGVRVGEIVLGPWAYYEHAQEEAQKRGGVVVRFRKFKERENARTRDPEAGNGT